MIYGKDQDSAREARKVVGDMPIFVDDVIQITANQTYQGEKVLNVYYYKVRDVAGGETLADTLENGFLPIIDAITPIQDDGVLYPSISALNLSNGLDYAEIVTGRQGALAGLPMASFVAWSFRLVRASRLTRHGGKRIVGVIEEWVDGNTANPSQPQMSNAEAALSADLDLYNTIPQATGSAVPVIVGRCRLTDVGCTPGELDLSRVNGISAAQFLGLSSQVSRKAPFS